MSRYGLRDISERLTRSTDTEAVVFEFLGYLQTLHDDWRATMAFYEPSLDALVRLYERQGDRLVGREASVPVDRLPPRLVRKFFHPSAFFNAAARRGVRSDMLQAAPFHEADPTEAPGLRAVVPIPDWRSCLCVPLTDRDDVMGLLVVASRKRGAFPAQALDEIIPLRSLAAFALAHHLHRERGGAAPEPHNGGVTVGEFQDRIRALHARTQELERDNASKAEQLERLQRELEAQGRDSSQANEALDRAKHTMSALEEQTVVATEHLTQAYTQLDDSRSRLETAERSLGLVRDVCRAVAGEHNPRDLVHNLLTWVCGRFGIERCSLMLLDGGGQTLQIAAQCGMDLGLVSRVRVRVGQGVAGWVAANHRPLLVRAADDAPGLTRCGPHTYNSDSFISVPVMCDGVLSGVLNMSNKAGGEPFDEADLELAGIVAAMVAMVDGGSEEVRRAA